ncbi:methyl-accepting chemotaxis protein [Domibacillus sp. PGB-M46]|uniref:methyl-accepting chemotaxis protein n=1 Tax=Domibacillus sp. PGB-M46 TaxID=2910255 RepID=UPI001F5AD31E|nr:methyl-accepting chemotaxis protein [Domibacillus sp. PGB-M46]MCI2257195.1 methyl-accepting chemotaxis protein [Domibacillus sp. PGB-M46]
MGTSAKLVSAFIVMAVTVGLVGIYGLINLGKVNEQLDFMYEERVVPISDIGSAETNYQRIRVSIRDMVFVAKTSEEKKKFADAIKEIQGEIEASIEKYESTYVIESEQQLLDQFHPALEEYYNYLAAAQEYAYANDTAAYLKLAPAFKASGDEVQSILKELIELNKELGQQSSEEAAALENSARTITIAVIIFAVLFSVGIGYLLARMISKPLNNVVSLVENVSKGDLTETTDIDTKDEIGLLANSVNNMVLSLRKTVGNISASAENVAASSQEISATTEEIASSASSQANDAQTITELFRDIASSSESQAEDAQAMKERFKELNDAIESIAKSAEETADLSDGMLRVSKEAGQVVQTSMEGMNKVSEQMTILEAEANKIGSIINVINDIANQTNLLALNAAIEAARAGEQGKGFAVVADEVRKLAEQSSSATKEIVDIIHGIQSHTKQTVEYVNDGVGATNETEKAFAYISEMVNEAAGKVNEIAAASDQQSAQSDEVMRSIESIASASEQQSAQIGTVMKSVESIAGASEEAAAASEETAATSQSLANLAEDLNHSVSIFKVK